MFHANSELKLEVLASSNYGISIQGITVCPEGNIYIGPSHCVVKIDTTNNQSLYAGNPSRERYETGNRLKEASFDTVGGLRIIEDILYICDRGAGVVARVEGDMVVTWAGRKVKGSKDGPKELAEFSYPTDIIFFQGKFFISDYDNNLIRIVENGIVTSIKCTGRPFGFASLNDQHLFVSCHMGNNIREIVADENGFRAALIAGKPTESNGHCNGDIQKSLFYRTRGLVIAGESNDLYVADCLNHMIRKLSVDPPSTQEKEEANSFQLIPEEVETDRDCELASIPYRYVSDFCGTGNQKKEDKSGLNVQLQYPYFMALTPDGDLVWSEEYQKNVKIIRNFDPYSSVLKNPCIEMRTNKFSDFALLLQTDLLPHVKLLHAASQRIFILHMSLINLSLGPISESHLHLLETSELSDFALERFFSFVYGSMSDSSELNGTDLAFYWANNVALLNRLERDEKSDLFAFALSQFITLLPTQSLSDIFKMLFLIENEGKISDMISLNLLKVISVLLGDDWTSSDVLKPLEVMKDTKRRETLMKGIATPVEPPIPRKIPFPFRKMQTGLEMIAQSLQLNTDPSNNSIESISEHSSRVCNGSSDATRSLPAEFVSSLKFSHLPSSNASCDQDTPSKSKNLTQLSGYHASCVMHPDIDKRIPPNLVIGIEKTDYSVSTHDWILYTRWGYFRRAVDSRIWDVASKRLNLPEDFPPSLLVPLLQYISSGGTFMTKIESYYDCIFLQLRGGEFDLMDLDGLPKPGFARLLDHARRRLLQPPSLLSCIPSFYFAVESGLTERAKILETFIQNHFEDLLASPLLVQELNALPEHVSKYIKSK